jgi:hypothetical protein
MARSCVIEALTLPIKEENAIEAQRSINKQDPIGKVRREDVHSSAAITPMKITNSQEQVWNYSWSERE